MIIRLKVFEQTLSIADTKSVPRKGSKDYLALQFLFSSDWKDLNKICYLQKGDVSQPIDVVDGIVEVPEWFTEQDSFDVTLFGKSGTQEVPTNVVALQLEKSNTLWEQAAPEPQPSWLAKVIDMNNHPPVPGNKGYWLLWDTDKGEYVESDLPLPEDVPLATYEIPGKVMPSSDFDIAADGTLSLYKAMAVQSVTTNKSAAYEIGTEVEGLELSWALNKSPATLRVQVGATLLNDLPANVRSTTELNGSPRTQWTQLTATISQDMQFSVKATDARGVESSKSTAIRFLRYAYSKVGAPDAAPTTASECVKQADLATFGKNGADFTYTVDSCIWLLTTKQAAKIQTNVLGQWADVTTYGGEAVEFTQDNGTTATYYAYRTDTFTGAGTAKYRIV